VALAVLALVLGGVFTAPAALARPGGVVIVVPPPTPPPPPPTGISA